MTWDIGVQDRNLVDSTEWRCAIEAVDDAVVEHLRDIGFDEARYGARVGFGKLKWCVSTFFAHASSCRCMQCLSSTLGILALIRELSYAPGIWRRNCREGIATPLRAPSPCCSSAASLSRQSSPLLSKTWLMRMMSQHCAKQVSAHACFDRAFMCCLVLLDCSRRAEAARHLLQPCSMFSAFRGTSRSCSTGQWTLRQRSLAPPRSRSMQRAAFLGCAP